MRRFQISDLPKSNFTDTSKTYLKEILGFLAPTSPHITFQDKDTLINLLHYAVKQALSEQFGKAWNFIEQALSKVGKDYTQEQYLIKNLRWLLDLWGREAVEKSQVESLEKFKKLQLERK